MTSCPFPIDSTLADLWWKRAHPMIQMQMQQAKLAKQIKDRGGSLGIFGLSGVPLGLPLKVLSEQEAMRACTPEELAENGRRQYEHYRAYMADPAREERLLAPMRRRKVAVDVIIYPPRSGLMKWLFG